LPTELGADRRDRRSSVRYGGWFSSRAAGIPTIVCGPGSIEQAHQADEWIAVDQLSEATRFSQARAAQWARNTVT